MDRWATVAMEYSRGRVCHAVAGAMRVLLQDWHLMVTQLEHQMLTGHLTLQACYLHMLTPSPPLRHLPYVHACACLGTSAGVCSQSRCLHTSAGQLSSAMLNPVQLRLFAGCPQRKERSCLYTGQWNL